MEEDMEDCGRFPGRIKLAGEAANPKAFTWPGAAKTDLEGQNQGLSSRSIHEKSSISSRKLHQL